MKHLWASIDPRSPEPRLLVTNAGKKPLLKARMSRSPQHPRALQMLLEAIALWEGKAIRAVLIVDTEAPYDLTHYHDSGLEPCESPLYSLEYVPPLAVVRRRNRDQLHGMGRFHDLRQLMLFEVAQ